MNSLKDQLTYLETMIQQGPKIAIPSFIPFQLYDAPFFSLLPKEPQKIHANRYLNRFAKYKNIFVDSLVLHPPAPPLRTHFVPKPPTTPTPTLPSDRGKVIVIFEPISTNTYPSQQTIFPNPISDYPIAQQSSNLP